MTRIIGAIQLTVELTPEQAAGLKRFAEKVGHSDAMEVLYPHRPREQRSDQAYTIMQAFAAIETALADADVSSWPWVESGRVV